MLELNIYQNNNQSAETFGKWYARVETKEQMSVYDMVVHMAKHNTPFSAGTIEGILRDFVDCVREQCLQGNTVKIENLAIFKASVTANGLALGENYKVTAGLGCVPATKNDDGMKVSAIAKELSLPYKQVENRLGQARKAVRQQLRCCV